MSSLLVIGALSGPAGNSFPASRYIVLGSLTKRHVLVCSRLGSSMGPSTRSPLGRLMDEQQATAE
jgi:hypothetical protein